VLLDDVGRRLGPRVLPLQLVRLHGVQELVVVVVLLRSTLLSRFPAENEVFLKTNVSIDFRSKNSVWVKIPILPKIFARSFSTLTNG
jgi:hypothetical protein